MSKIDHLTIEDLYGSRIKTFQKLMRHKIRDVLLVSSLYDDYLFEEDGRLYELIRQESQVLNLSHPPEITHATSGAEAIELATVENNFDLIITTLHIEDMHVIKFAQMVRQVGLQIPIVLLAYDNREHLRPHFYLAGRFPATHWHHQVCGRPPERGERHHDGRRAVDHSCRR